MFRQTLLRQARLFSTNARVQKSATETVKDAAKAVDRTVSDAAIKGIEVGESTSASLKSAVGIKASEASGKASEVAGEAKGKAAEVAGQAKAKDGSAEELAGQVKGKAHEVAGQAKGKVEEIKGKMS